MAKLSVYNFISLNGCYKGPNNSLWHIHGDEETEYSKDSLKSDSILLFGRVTYEMMVSFWPTEDAKKNMPEVAEGMNKSEKIVFSKSLKKADWNNTRIVSDNVVEEVKKLKSAGKDMTILGSGTIVTQFTDAGLIDSYEIMVDPIVISGGTQMFSGIAKDLNLKLKDSKTFKSGVVLLTYEVKK